MSERRPPYVLGVLLALSLLANVALGVLWFGAVLSEGYLSADTGSTFEAMAGERTELRTMRTHFCPSEPAPDRATLLAWERATRAPGHTTDPFEKDGLLWLDHVAVKLDANDRVVGICQPQTWGALDPPSHSAADEPSQSCPLERLC